MTDHEQTAEPLETPLAGLHRTLGGKMVPFAGYTLPVQYPTGVMTEHTHTRDAAGLFDVSHMGQIMVSGADAAAALEALIPANIVDLQPGRQRYGLLTNAKGGIEDDLMVARRSETEFLLVVNAACKVADLALLQAGLPGCTVTMLDDRALIALQGPMAEPVLAAILPAAAQMRFMDVVTAPYQDSTVWISRSGYTGEDGFEISVPAALAQGFAEQILSDDRAAPIGLGARDSLRLEAGLCLYGQDMDGATTPAVAALGWAIPKIRRTGGAREGGFPGASVILPELVDGADAVRVGLRPEGRAPMRTGVTLFADETSDAAIGHVTSGGFGPTLGAPVAMARLASPLTEPGTRVWGEMRGKRFPAVVSALPFVQQTYKR